MTRSIGVARTWGCSALIAVLVVAGLAIAAPAGASSSTTSSDLMGNWVIAPAVTPDP